MKRALTYRHKPKLALAYRHKTKRAHRRRSPALMSLGIQCLALAAVLGCSILWGAMLNQHPATDGLFIMQAIFASALA